MKKGIKKGFTLAEILITLTIIGVVASLTIPTVINSTSNRQYEVAVKKAFSTFSNAVNMQKAETGDLITLFSQSTSADMLDVLSDTLNLTKTCTAVADCWTQKDSEIFVDSTNVYTDILGTYQAHGILADGMIFAVENLYSSCSANYGCANIIIDINGAKGPNIVGKDIFAFSMGHSGVIPVGSSIDFGYDDGLGDNSDPENYIPTDGSNSVNAAFAKTADALAGNL